MKAQAEIIVFLLLFIIGILLFASATVWSRGIFQENVGFSRLESTEKFMKDLDGSISDVIKFGGMRELEYGIGGTIELLDPEKIEVRVPLSLQIQENWVNISESNSYIEEKKDGNNLVLRLVYPEGDYKVFFFTDGSSLAQPTFVKIEKNSTVLGSPSMIKIKITFV
jgi:hypothetical protein